jgi:CheY-like chemotaxis protein
VRVLWHWELYWVAQRCLIVDDSSAFLSSACALLESQGIQVAACVLSGEEALVVAARSDLDLALIDVELGDEDGLELARALVRQHPALPVVLMSAHELEDVEDLVAGCGAVGFIAKTSFGRSAIEAVLEC